MADAVSAQKLLASMKKYGASDMHLKAGYPPVYRVGRQLRSLSLPPMSGEEIDACLSEIIPSVRRPVFDTTGNLDFSAGLPDGERFRVNLFKAGDKMNAAIRRVNSEIPTYEDLHLPPAFHTLIEKTREGIIIVCGVTGSGKSTTLAAMIQQINTSRRENIVTIEDPVEYLFKPDKSVISQREIGIDVESFEEGLKYVVRQDPDVILIGEMRDKHTVMAALQAAETGHLVFGTLHTADTVQAFNRILKFFPQIEHDFVRSSLSSCLRAICAQRLLPGANAETPVVPATELLLNTTTCRELIRKGQDDELPSLVSSSEADGMHSFVSSLARLVEHELVNRDEAMKWAPSPEALVSQLRGIKTQSQSMVQRSRGTGK